MWYGKDSEWTWQTLNTGITKETRSSDKAEDKGKCLMLFQWSIFLFVLFFQWFNFLNKKKNPRDTGIRWLAHILFE